MKRPYLWIILAVLVVYGQVLFFKYTYLDDYTLLVENSDYFVHGQNLFRIFTTDFISSVTGGQYYRPFFTASLILNGVIAGQSPFLFHLTDLLLHLGVALLLYRFLTNITRSKSAALFGSLVFSVHPLLIQTVAWIPARCDLMAALFVLWYLTAFDQALKNPGEKKHYLYAALAMALAIGSKESAMLIPLISLAYVWAVSSQAGKYKTLLRFVPIWIALAGLWLLGRSVTLTNDAEFTFQKVFSSVYFSLSAVVQYLGKLLFPFDLSTYPVIADINLTHGLIVLLVLALGILVSKQKRNRIIIFGAVWFFAFLLLSLVRINTVPYSEVLEHRAYIPFIGILIIILEFDFLKKSWLESRRRFAVVCAILAVLAIINITHASSFKSGLKYWEQAVKTSPSSPFGYKQLGTMYHMEGNIAAAEDAYEKVISMNPEETLIYNNLGFLYATSGRSKEAEVMYRLEIETNPDFFKTYMNLGNLYWETGRIDEAEKFWQKTIELNPYFFPAYRNLAIYYYEKDQYDKGIVVLDEIINHGGKIDSDLLDAYKQLVPAP